MAKLLISNNAEWQDLLLETYRNAGFEISASADVDNVLVTAYKKLCVESCNYYQQDDDFVVSTGTLFYKKKFGEEALSALLIDSKHDDIKKLRSQMLGSYAVVIKTGNQVRVFVDETHTYDLYYYCNSAGKFVITNTFYHVQKCVGCALNPDIVLERGVRGGVLGLSTPFEGINGIGARDVLEIDLESGDFTIGQCELNSYGCEYSSAEEAVNTIWKRSQSAARLRSKYLNKSLYFVTGGVDSRVELSAATYNGENISLGYWMGSDCITNGTKSDLELQKEIAKKLNIDHRCYDVSVAFCDAIDGLTPEFCDKYGEHASIYSGNAKWFSIFENLSKVQYIGFGFFGETIRTIESIDLEMGKDSKLDDFLKNVYCRTHIEDLVASESFANSLHCEAMRLLGADYDSTAEISPELCAKLFGYSRFSADCVLSNFANLFTFSFPLLGTKQVADAIFSLPYEWKSDDRIAIELIDKWNSELLELPFFSHHHNYFFDREERKLLPVRTFDLRGLLKEIKPLRYIYRKYLRSHVGGRSEAWNSLFDQCRALLSKSKTIKKTGTLVIRDEEPEEIELATLATFVAQLKVLEYLIG